MESIRAGIAVELVGRMRGGAKAEVRRRTDELFELLQLEEWRDRIGQQTTGGVRRLVGFMMTTVVQRPVVILDEPTNDIDPMRRRLLWQEIRNVANRGAAVLLVTHNVLEAERVVDRLATIDPHPFEHGTRAASPCSVARQQLPPLRELHDRTQLIVWQHVRLHVAPLAVGYVVEPVPVPPAAQLREHIGARHLGDVAARHAAESSPARAG